MKSDDLSFGIDWPHSGFKPHLVAISAHYTAFLPANQRADDAKRTARLLE